MAKIPCTVCGREFSDAVLLYGDEGRICVDCQAEADEAAEASGRVWSLMVAGPLLAFAATAGTLGGCVPMLGLFFLGLAPFFALFGVVAGVRAAHAGATRPEGIDDSKAGMLLAVGIVSAVWSAVVGLGALPMLIVQLGAIASVW